MEQEAVYARREAPRLRVVGDQRFGSLEGEIRYPYEATMAFQVTTHTDPRGMVVLLTLVEPVGQENARPTLDRLHRSLAIRPMEVVREGEAILQPRAPDLDHPN